MLEKTKNIDDLIQRIEIVLSNNRCSLLEKDKAILLECKTELQNLKNEAPDPISTMEVVTKVIELLLVLFTCAEKLSDVF